MALPQTSKHRSLNEQIVFAFPIKTHVMFFVANGSLQWESGRLKVRMLVLFSVRKVRGNLLAKRCASTSKASNFCVVETVTVFAICHLYADVYSVFRSFKAYCCFFFFCLTCTIITFILNPADAIFSGRLSGLQGHSHSQIDSFATLKLRMSVSSHQMSSLLASKCQV